MTSLIQPTPDSPTSKQKAKLLLKMANAVEDSSARRRQKLHDKVRIDGEAVDHLIGDLERQKARGQDVQKETPNTTFTLSLEPDHRARGGNPVHPQQIHLLYTAMIRYRENAELKYQLLELRHLDLSRSFLELESRYRHLESEREAWKQSCQVLEQAATAGSLDVSARSARSVRSARSHGKLGASVAGANPAGPPNAALGRFQKSTLPILQQELKMLSSQRNQLLQANLELRKQLKQMQIQMQTPKAEDSMTATCRRCHPELLAGRQQFAQDAFSQIVEEFHSSSTSIPAPSPSSPPRTESQRQLSDSDTTFISFNESKEDQILDQSAYSDNNTLDESDPQQKEQKHQHKMNLLGMHFSDGPPKRNSLMVVATEQQKSIVWSPPTQSHDHPHHPSSNSRALTPPKSKSSGQQPTMNSILPMKKQNFNPKKQQQQQQQQMEDIEVSPRRDVPTARVTLQQDFQDFPQVESAPQKFPSSKTLKSTSSSNSGEIHVTPKQEMDRFGMLDEFGRARSYRKKKDDASTTATGSTTKSPNNSCHSGMTITTSNTTNDSSTAKSMPRFRRKTATVVPQQHVQPQAAPAANRQQQQRRPQRHSVATTLPARHLEYAVPGGNNPRQGGSPPQATAAAPTLMNVRHLEFSTSGAQPPPPRTPVQQQQQQQPPQPHYPPQQSRRPQEAAIQQQQSRSHPPAVRNPPPNARGTRAPQATRGGASNPTNNGSGPPQRRQASSQPQKHLPRGKQQQQQQVEEQHKPERARPSYFERIKKTLQQEI